ncbi:hypothetical protein N0V88_001457 [Collariella sp. IMI 366227]|nr:hypothetical protein N0V88_001457 [Collariella sp. IMI 366227]
MVLKKLLGGWGGKQAGGSKKVSNNQPNSNPDEKNEKNEEDEKDKKTVIVPIWSKEKPPALDVQLYPFESKDGLLVKIQPPKEPANEKLDHVPCDIILCIDVSGSMSADAPVPTKPGEKEEEEYSGLSVLDLVKHAARTILETLDATDRLGIVTFASQSNMIFPLSPMTEGNKAKALKAIEYMQPLDMTNLWHGIRDGLQLLEEGSKSHWDSAGRVPALLVLTDGKPNHMCPRKGYVPKLRSMGPLPAIIHTFGFGYNLRSGLLQSIAEVSGGNYAFIPDAGMIGTVFVHAVANLQATCATNAKLRLTYPSHLQLEETTGDTVGKQEPVELKGDVPEALASLTINLGHIQYGQSRDICLRYSASSLEPATADTNPPLITATVEYNHLTPTIHRASAHKSALDFSSPLDPAEKAYHVSLLTPHFLHLRFLPPQQRVRTHRPPRHPKDIPGKLLALAESLPQPSSHPPTPAAALLLDLCGDPLPTHLLPKDINPPPTTPPPPHYPLPTPRAIPRPHLLARPNLLALSNPAYYYCWGAHYLLPSATPIPNRSATPSRILGPCSMDRIVHFLEV